MNDRDREQWVLNDEGLYDRYRMWRKRNKGGLRGFVRAHREFIDQLTGDISEGKRRQHCLKYGE